MAILLNTKTGEQVILRSQHIFGRHPGSSNTVLTNPEASRMHASILFNGSHWLLQDTSSNGTFLNGKHYVHGVKHRLHKGDKINFGNNTLSNWKLINTDPPKSMLVPLTANMPTIELEDIAVLPNEEVPEVMVYRSPEGSWLYEDHTGRYLLNAGDKVSTHHFSWYFVNADTLEETQMAAPDAEDNEQVDIKIDFEVSQNEEHISLNITVGDQLISLGQRTHHYLLLILARQRLEDIQVGRNESEQGWLDKEVLSRMLGMEESHINIQIYRFRKQIIQAHPASPALLQIVERRRGELRFASDAVTINGG
jgi:pSer/pThr/pTyr-binding forkhead associated (FHA) protein